MTDTIISQQLTVNVPADYPDIQSALDAFEGKMITGGVNIQVADGEYQITAPLVSRIRDYDKLTLRGNEQDCSKCVLYIDNSANKDGFLFENGFGISWLNGFTLAGVNGWTASGVWNDQCYGAGIRATGGGTVILGPALSITKMYYGLRAMNGAFISNETVPESGQPGGGIKVSNAGDVAFHAYAATLKVNCAEAWYASHSSESLGFGFCAEAGGFLQCEYAISSGNERAGFYALTNGTVWAHGTTAQNNLYGVLAWGGVIECNSLGEYTSSFSLNSEAGIYATYNGFVGANTAWCSQNTHGVMSDNGGLVDITYLRSENNTGNGFYARQRGTMSGGYSSAQNNQNNGYHCEYGSCMAVSHAAANGNTNHGFYARKNSGIYCEGFGGTGNGYFCSPVQMSISGSTGNSEAYIDDTL